VSAKKVPPGTPSQHEEQVRRCRGQVANAELDPWHLSKMVQEHGPRFGSKIPEHVARGDKLEK
jgi:hypothetical protein